MRQNWNHKSHSVGAAPPNVSAFSGLKHMRENISILYTITIWGCLELALKNDIKFVFAWQADKHTHTQTNRLVARQINWNRLTKPTWQCIWAKLPSFGCIKWHKKAKDILMASRLVDLPMASNKSQECQATWNNLSQANDQNKAKGSKKGAKAWWGGVLPWGNGRGTEGSLRLKTNFHINFDLAFAKEWAGGAGETLWIQLLNFPQRTNLAAGENNVENLQDVFEAINKVANVNCISCSADFLSSLNIPPTRIRSILSILFNCYWAFWSCIASLWQFASNWLLYAFAQIGTLYLSICIRGGPAKLVQNCVCQASFKTCLLARYKCFLSGLAASGWSASPCGPACN